MKNYISLLILLVFALSGFGQSSGTTKMWNARIGNNMYVGDTCDLHGKILFESGNPGVGKVWTSDAFGYGSWVTVTGTGTVTSVGSGSGLTGGPITGTGTLKADTSLLATKNSIGFIKANGSVPLRSDWNAGAFKITNLRDSCTSTLPSYFPHVKVKRDIQLGAASPDVSFWGTPLLTMRNDTNSTVMDELMNLTHGANSRAIRVVGDVNSKHYMFYGNFDSLYTVVPSWANWSGIVSGGFNSGSFWYADGTLGIRAGTTKSRPTDFCISGLVNGAQSNSGLGGFVGIHDSVPTALLHIGKAVLSGLGLAPSLKIDGAASLLGTPQVGAIQFVQNNTNDAWYLNNYSNSVLSNNQILTTTSTMAANYIPYATTSSNFAGTSAFTYDGTTLALNRSLTDNHFLVKLTSTLPSGTTTTNNRTLDIQTTTGSSMSAGGGYGVYSFMLAGATDGTTYCSGRFQNNVAGTGIDPYSTNVGNFGVWGLAAASTTGTNVGTFGYAASGNVSLAVLGTATTAKNSATNVGVVGMGLNTGTSPIQVGGYFGLQSSSPTYASAALIADNGATTSPALLIRNNGTVVLKVDNNSNINLAATGSALSTSATNGFTYLPNCAGLPTGVPASLPTGATPMVYNSTSNVMMAYNSGWKNVAAGVAYNHTIFTPTTGSTVTLINNQYNIINPAGSILAITLNLPSSPANNDVVIIKFTQTVSTVTYANGTVVDGITAPTAGGMTVLTYDSGTTSWY